MIINRNTNPEIIIVMENGDRIVLEMYPEIAPNTVKNFVYLADQGFYDGLIFHRVIEGFMIQGGDPLGTGTGGPGYRIKGEFSSNNFANNLNHIRGVISMGRSPHPDSAGSQFFIMHQDSHHLDGNYAAFGKVIEGLEVVDKIATIDTDFQDRPLEPQIIKKMIVSRYFKDYDEPEKIN